MVFSVCCHARQVWSKQQFLYAHPSGPFTTQCFSGMNQQTCSNMDIMIIHPWTYHFFFFCLFFVFLFLVFLFCLVRHFLDLLWWHRRHWKGGGTQDWFCWGCAAGNLKLDPHKYPGGTDLERGYGDVRPWRPPFHASSAARKGPISSKRVRSQDPLLRKFGNFNLTASIFTQILAHKPPNLEIFSSQAPKFGNFPLTSPPPPFQRQMSVRKPHTSEVRATHPYRKKKGWVPPPDKY